jgi:hypothetical protein
VSSLVSLLSRRGASVGPWGPLRFPARTIGRPATFRFAAQQGTITGHLLECQSASLAHSTKSRHHVHSGHICGTPDWKAVKNPHTWLACVVCFFLGRHRYLYL